MFSYLKNIIKKCKNAESYTPSQFYLTQWQKSNYLSGTYVIYRWIVALTFLILLFAAMLDVGKNWIDYAKFFIYLTHWGFILCTIQALLAACMVTLKYKELSNVKNDVEKLEIMSRSGALTEIYWIMYTMSVVCAFGITIIFWTRVYIPSYHELGIMVFMFHGFNTVLMLMDVVIVAHPLKFMHFLWTLGFVLIYLFFSYVYYLAGGTNSKNSKFIYHSLDWDKPEHALKFCVSSLVFGFIIHLCMWSFSAIIRRISNASRREENISGQSQKSASEMQTMRQI